MDNRLKRLRELLEMQILIINNYFNVFFYKHSIYMIAYITIFIYNKIKLRITPQSALPRGVQNTPPVFFSKHPTTFLLMDQTPFYIDILYERRHYNGQTN